MTGKLIPKHPGRWLFWGAITLGAALAFWQLSKPQPVWVETAAALRAPLAVVITEEGKTRVQDRYLLSAPVNGYQRRITLNVGDRVAAGEPVTWLDPLYPQVLDARARATAQVKVAAAQAGVQSAAQNVAAARAESQLADSHFQRLSRLGQTDFVARDALQNAETAMLRAAAQLRSSRFIEEIARHELAAARIQLDVSSSTPGSEHTGQLAINAPVTGIVLNKRRESEGVVSAGEALLELGEPSALEVVVEMLSMDAVSVQPGMPVTLDGWGGPALEGRVRVTEPVGFTKVSALGVEEQRVRVLVDILAPHPEWQNLGDGYRVDAHVRLWQADEVLQIPRAALFHAKAGSAAYVVEAGQAVWHTVSTGQDDGFMVQILSGLEQGDIVVLHPDERIAEGVAVVKRE